MNCNWGWNSIYHFGGPLFWAIALAALMFVAWKVMAAKKVKTSGALSCYRCGNYIEYSFMRCPHCGAELKSHCPECSRIIENDWKFCPECSISLNKETNNTN